MTEEQDSFEEPRRDRSSRFVILAAIAILLVAGGVVGWRYLTAQREEDERAQRSAVLTKQLAAMRNGLSEYAKKHGRYPNSLDEMVASGQIPSIPVDPVTQSAQTWRLVREATVAVDEFSDSSADESNAPIVDIRSGAPGADSAGVPWSEY